MADKNLEQIYVSKISLSTRIRYHSSTNKFLRQFSRFVTEIIYLTAVNKSLSETERHHYHKLKTIIYFQKQIVFLNSVPSRFE